MSLSWRTQITPIGSEKNMDEVNPVTYELSKYGVCLPNGNNLNDDDVEYVCHYFKKALNIN